VGLIARKLEEAGLPTVMIGSCRDMMAQVRPPRSVFVDFPLGRQCGKPGDKALQRSILLDALRVLAEASAPGEIVDLPYEWGEPFDFSGFLKSLEEMLREEGASVQEWKPQT